MNTKYINGKYINCKLIADELLDGVKANCSTAKSYQDHTPTYVVISVAADESAKRYINSKEAKSKLNGINCIVDSYGLFMLQDELIEIINGYNNDDNIDGIIVQLPLPNHIDAKVIASHITPKKDLDGLNPVNIGKLNSGYDLVDMAGNIPCTAHGIILMLAKLEVNVEGKNVVIIGRSNIVGRPLRSLFEHLNASVTLLHSKTPAKQLRQFTRNADIVISAVGQIGIFDSTYFGSNQIIIDVGTTVDEDGKLKGDIEVDSVLLDRCKAITSVPGGVGPLTVAMLLYNVMCTRIAPVYI